MKKYLPAMFMLDLCMNYAGKNLHSPRKKAFEKTRIEFRKLSKKENEI